MIDIICMSIDTLATEVCELIHIKRDKEAAKKALLDQLKKSKEIIDGIVSAKEEL